MAESVRVVINERGIRDIVGSADVRDLLLEVADPIVDGARTLAPKRSGLGARSIHAEDVHDGFEWTVRIGWTTERYYMRFQDEGTQYIDARHFLELALEGALL